jgi:hemoglobin-like flavoprotein
MLDDRQKVLVQESWSKAMRDSDRLAEVFYGKMFELDPKLERLFANASMLEQGRKLTQMVTVVIGDIETLQALTPAVRALGARHVDYGVTDQQYDTVEQAILWALGQVLGPEYTPETEAAWKAMYEMMANTMKAGARAVRTGSTNA